MVRYRVVVDEGGSCGIYGPGIVELVIGVVIGCRAVG